MSMKKTALQDRLKAFAAMLVGLKYFASCEEAMLEGYAGIHLTFCFVTSLKLLLSYPNKPPPVCHPKPFNSKSRRSSFQFTMKISVSPFGRQGVARFLHII
jgi:hypothetical protein